jgi:hypothetical protein
MLRTRWPVGEVQSEVGVVSSNTRRRGRRRGTRKGRVKAKKTEKSHKRGCASARVAIICVQMTGTHHKRGEVVVGVRLGVCLRVRVLSVSLPLHVRYRNSRSRRRESR